jgi:hypothetical protein
MNETMRKKEEVDYVKPTILNLGPAVLVHGADCGNGTNASTDCNPGGTPESAVCFSAGTSAGGYCSPTGLSPRDYT